MPKGVATLLFLLKLSVFTASFFGPFVVLSGSVKNVVNFKGEWSGRLASCCVYRYALYVVDIDR